MDLQAPLPTRQLSLRPLGTPSSVRNQVQHGSIDYTARRRKSSSVYGQLPTANPATAESTKPFGSALASREAANLRDHGLTTHRHATCMNHKLSEINRGYRLRFNHTALS